MIPQIRITITSVIARSKISRGVMLRISPIRYCEYLENPPPADRITSPNAMAVDENTLITVSAEAVLPILHA